LTHFLCEDIVNVYCEIAADCGLNYDVYLLFVSDAPVDLVVPEGVSAFATNGTRLMEFGFPKKGILKDGKRSYLDLELPVLDFLFSYTQYEYVWLAEYDVRLSGPWNMLFDHFRSSSADYLGTTVRRYSEDQRWPYWFTLESPRRDLPKEKLLHSFTPIYRLSRRAALLLEREYRRGWGGYLECTIPTIIDLNELIIEDIGGDGSFVKSENRNRFYRNTAAARDLAPGTFAMLPIRERAGGEPGMLWHPVKPLGTRTWGAGRTIPQRIANRLRLIWRQGLFMARRGH
jgi:hypothetical protein